MTPDRETEEGCVLQAATTKQPRKEADERIMKSGMKQTN